MCPSGKGPARCCRDSGGQQKADARGNPSLPGVPVPLSPPGPGHRWGTRGDPTKTAPKGTPAPQAPMRMRAPPAPTEICPRHRSRPSNRADLTAHQSELGSARIFQSFPRGQPISTRLPYCCTNQCRASSRLQCSFHRTSRSIRAPPNLGVFEGLRPGAKNPGPPSLLEGGRPRNEGGCFAQRGSLAWDYFERRKDTSTFGGGAFLTGTA